MEPYKTKSYLAILTCGFVFTQFGLVHGLFDGWKLLDDFRAGAMDFVGDLQGKYEAVNKMSGATCSALGLECCRAPDFRGIDALRELEIDLQKKYFGQHIAVQIVLKTLKEHFRDQNPGKPLVYSFHGWSGSGKSYLSELIAESLYKKGLESKFIKRYMATLDFPDSQMLETYKDKVKRDIKDTLRNCRNALFIFDEVDSTPPGVFDSIIPFVDSRGKIDGVQANKAVFIFLSNTGAPEINTITLGEWESGTSREDLSFRHFARNVSREAFNKIGSGLYRSKLIERGLVDYYIPFLPLERPHVIKCADVEANRLGGFRHKIDLEKVADTLQYWPDDVKRFSTTGCRQVENAVKLAMSGMRGTDEL